jgi:hypothetical protein
MPIAWDKKRKSALGSMLRMLPRLAFGIVIVLAPLGLGGCADSLTADQNQHFSQLMKPYDKTLTKDQQKAAIEEMQSEQVKHVDAATEAGGNTSAAKPTTTN